MKEKNTDTLKMFHPLVQRWFNEQVGTPTDIQARSWPVIARKNHVLITAPTGSGKTLTAFLWAVNRFLVKKEPKETLRVLYISPLKALNNDIRRNLEKPLEELRQYFNDAGEVFPEIRTAVRSGDTDPSERRKMLRRPPEILITTPESLNVLLSSKSGRKILAGLSTVILDEIHAVVPTKRGTYLMTAVERLVPLCGEFQRIALSATVKPMERIADFIGGYQIKGPPGSAHYEKRRVMTLKSGVKKQYGIRVDFPETDGGQPDSEAWWPSLTSAFRDIIDNNRSALFFANSRRMVEKVTRLINDTDGPRVYSHHGSLAKEIRSVVEKRFKDGELSAIISTSSLELGIDIGSVDEVVLIQTPFSIASAIQRIGRSGHGVGQVSKGTFYPIHTRNLVEAAVLANHIDNESVESITPLEAPLDVLAQVLLSMTLLESRDIDELYDEIRTSYPYRNIRRKEFDLVLEMLAGRYADARIRELKPRLLIDRVKNTAAARSNASMLLFLSGGVIPDRGYYNLRVAETKAKIGELDEEFVWERSLGDAFPLGNQVWRILRVTHNDVEVSQVAQSNTLIPFWRAEEMNRSYHLSEKIGDFLQEAEAELEEKDFQHKLSQRSHMSKKAAEELTVYLKRQRKETGAPLPHRRHLLVEHFNDPANISDAKQTVLHTLWGGPVNRPFAFALAAAWEEKHGVPLETFVNNDCIMLNLPHRFNFADIMALVQPSKVRGLLRKKLESTGYFGARFRENAQRALLLPRQSFHKRMPLWLNRLRSKKLIEAVSRYEDFPILLETWRGCMNHDFEIDTLLSLLEEIASGEIAVTETTTRKPSPFADGIIWRQTNQYMYEDDSPRSKLRTSLSDTLLKEVMYSSHLRPRFPEDLLQSFQAKLHRTAPGYAPGAAEELLQWVRERLYIPAHEWRDLLAAVDRDHAHTAPPAGDEKNDETEMNGEAGAQPIDSETLVKEISDRLYFINKDRVLHAVTALENLPRVWYALGIDDAAKDAEKTARQLGLTAMFDDNADETLTAFLAEWLRFYGPVPREHLTACLGIGDVALSETLETLIEDGRIIVDEFRRHEDTKEADETAVIEEICDSENLEILLRMRRAKARPEIKPLPVDALPLFIASYQGLTAPGDGPEDLQNVMESLFGYSSRAGLWETDILPARLNPYYNSWLDSLMRDDGLLWFGAGNERIGFCFDSDYELFTVPAGKEKVNGKTKDTEPEHQEVMEKLEHFFSDAAGKFDLGDLSRSVQIPTDQLTAALWRLAWNGRLTNDHFKAVRTGVMNKFKTEAPVETRHQGHARHGRGRRLGFNRRKSYRAFTGNWFPLEQPDTDDVSMDALDRQELVKDRIRLLFMRYGVLFRELLWNELPGLRWSAVFPVLRLMELSGEIVSGHFFKGVPGLQFCTPPVLALLTRELPEDAIYWMNATDPASLCGTRLAELRPMLPHRLAGTHIVFHGRKPVLVSRRNGKELTLHVEPDHPRLAEYFGFFNVLVGREFQPVKYINVETVNERPVSESPYKQAMRDAGFQKDYKSMVLMKKY